MTPHASRGDWVDPREWNEHSLRDDRFPVPVEVIDVDRHDSTDGESEAVYLLQNSSQKTVWERAAWFPLWEGDR